MRPEPIDVDQLVRETVELAAPRAHEKGLEIGVVFAADAPNVVEGDAARLKQILFNLIGNAVKFTDTGGVRIDVSNAPDNEGRPRLALSVSDTGPGISEADQAHLFEHFERGAAERNGAEGGAGLGLAMVRRLVEAMESAMGVESELGEGAKFWVLFELPVQSLRNGEPLSGQRLAIAGPSAVLRETLADQLAALGAEIVVIDHPSRLAAASGLDILVDPAWAGPAREAGAQRIWQLVAPAEKDAVIAGAGTAGDGWFVKPIRAASLVDRLLGGSGEDAVPEGPDGLSGAEAVDLSSLSLLVAEDDPVNAMIARKCLERIGIDVTLVGDGASAVDAALGGRFDAALLDQRMPALDGPDVARAIRAAGLDLPLIALTANASEADRSLCLEAGMDEFLTKPLDPEKLGTALSRLCRTEKRASMR